METIQNKTSEATQNKTSESTQSKTPETTQNRSSETTQSKAPETSKSTETFKIGPNWGNQSTQLKAQFSTLSESDLKFETGKESELLGRLQAKLGKNREEVIDIIKKIETVQA